MTYSNLRALVVDDQELVRESVCDALRITGHEVIGEAATGEEAVALAQQLQPDIVLMDIQMPGIGGIEAAQRIRDLPQPIPVVFLSALDDVDSSERAAESGGFGYLVKPFHARQLGPVMRTAIRRFQEWLEQRGPGATSGVAPETLARFAARVQTGAIQAAVDELLAATGASLSAQGVAVCVLSNGSGEIHVPASWGQPLPDAARAWAASISVARQASQAAPESLGASVPALAAAPLPPSVGAEGALIAFRPAAFSPDDLATLEVYAAGMGEALGTFRAQQPLAWRRWLHAPRTDGQITR